MNEKKYWQSFGALNNSAAHQKQLKDEFQEELPFAEITDKMEDNGTTRRDFLKYLGFSTAAAMAAASCEMPVKKAIPYVNKPENLTPGVSTYYATTYAQEGEVIPILAKVRDGRPIKIEGNEKSTIYNGGTSSRVQASVLNLYDTARLRYPLMGNGEAPSFKDIDDAIAKDLTGVSGLVLLTSTVTSPSTKEVIAQFLAKYPGSRHIQYDGISYSGMLLANEASYGKRAIPSYHFDKAKVIVSLGADFLGTWLNPVEFANQYSKGRRINEKNPEMSKHYQFESMLSMTGANADERYVHRPSHTGQVALALYAALGGAVSANITDEKLKKGIEKAAKDLNANKGKALVVCGSNDVNVQIIVNAINEKIGAGGSTIDWSTTLNGRAGIDKDMDQLVADMNAGTVGALLIHDANPVYDYYNAEKFKSGLAKVKTSVSFNTIMDETTELCKYVIPDHNYLESWGDAEAKTGYISFIQPTIYPLFKTRAFQTSLLKWSGNDTEYATFFKNYWVNKLGSQVALDKALQDGLIEPAATAPTAATFKSEVVANAAAGIAAAKKGGETEVVLYQKVSIGSGKAANNPWLQEVPDPITKATWDNYAVISPQLAKKLGIELNDEYEVEVKKPVISLTVNGKSVELPILAIPGMHPDVIAVALGYGRSAKVGRAAAGVGVNVYQWASSNGTTVDYTVASATYAKTDKKQLIAYTQTHFNYDGRNEVIKETTLEEFKKAPDEWVKEREEEFKQWGENFRDDATLYPGKEMNERPGIHWGMSVDMNTCTGCSACVVACNAENNVSVVGRKQIAKAHEMHWLRIDRYFSGNWEDANSIQTVFQPMMCQHCDNAPCENVCPVNATNHSSEGLNQMTYNRCIGTRYCANNCPYKVRRFNWADWNGADSFPDNQQPLVEEGWMDDAVMMMNDDLTRMVLNPDVTVRARGVIEKCSFCVQRLQEAKLKAKKEDRPLKDGDAKTACMQACPTNAISFGNVNDKTSQVSKLRNEEAKNRTYYVIEQIHTLPNVSYIGKIRNNELELPDTDWRNRGQKKETHQEETKHA
jgi:molybdopterin-containing oxidoreductase family iron-sulfur binding subunit